jgi:hypothetical protein
MEGPVAAGVYLIETDEDSVDAASRLAWRRVATTIHVQAGGATQVVATSPAELDALLLRDQGASA